MSSLFTGPHAMIRPWIETTVRDALLENQLPLPGTQRLAQWIEDHFVTDGITAIEVQFLYERHTLPSLGSTVRLDVEGIFSKEDKIILQISNITALGGQGLRPPKVPMVEELISIRRAMQARCEPLAPRDLPLGNVAELFEIDLSVSQPPIGSVQEVFSSPERTNDAYDNLSQERLVKISSPLVVRACRGATPDSRRQGLASLDMKQLTTVFDGVDQAGRQEASTQKQHREAIHEALSKLPDTYTQLEEVPTAPLEKSATKASEKDDQPEMSQKGVELPETQMEEEDTRRWGIGNMLVTPQEEEEEVAVAQDKGKQATATYPPETAADKERVATSQEDANIEERFVTQQPIELIEETPPQFLTQQIDITEARQSEQTGEENKEPGWQEPGTTWTKSNTMEKETISPVLRKRKAAALSKILQGSSEPSNKRERPVRRGGDVLRSFL